MFDRRFRGAAEGRVKSMEKKRYSVRETWKVLTGGAPFPSQFVYDVSPILDPDAKPIADDQPIPILGYKKSIRLADHSAPPFWYCEHNHPTWNDAAECKQTPVTENPQKPSN
jgi:hypothetical protein